MNLPIMVNTISLVQIDEHDGAEIHEHEHRLLGIRKAGDNVLPGVNESGLR